jgi:hypothetical protein
MRRKLAWLAEPTLVRRQQAARLRQGLLQRERAQCAVNRRLFEQHLMKVVATAEASGRSADDLMAIMGGGPPTAPLSDADDPVQPTKYTTH